MLPPSRTGASAFSAVPASSRPAALPWCNGGRNRVGAEFETVQVCQALRSLCFHRPLPVRGPAVRDSHSDGLNEPHPRKESSVDDREQEATPELVADDVHRVLAAVTAEPASVFGSSGIAVTGLALATELPEQVRTLVAHEPRPVELLPDRARLRAAIDKPGLSRPDPGSGTGRSARSPRRAPG